MLEEIVNFISYPFIQRALIVGLLVSPCCALLGVSLVLKRYSMIGDGLSHVAFGAMAIALALNTAPLAAAIPTVIIAAFFLLRISEKSRIQGDAAIALIAGSSLAIGIIATSLKSGLNKDIYSYMFGSILTLNTGDIIMSAAISTSVLILYIFFYNKIFAVTFDESFARATGAKVGFYNTLIALLTAVTVVVGMQLMGAMLISSLIIFPALSSMRICKSFRGVVLISSILSLICFCAGIILSFVFSLPTGASIVVVNLIAFIFCALIGSLILKRL